MLTAVSRTVLAARVAPRAVLFPAFSVQLRLFAARSKAQGDSSPRKSRTTNASTPKRGTKETKTKENQGSKTKAGNAKATEQKHKPKANRPWERFDDNGKLIPLPYDTKPTRKHPFMVFVKQFSDENIGRPEFRRINAQGESKAVVTTLVRAAGAEWRNMGDAQRQKYIDEAARQSQMYEKELAEWRNNLTPDDIRRQNQYLLHRRKQGLTSRALLKDTKAPRRPLNSFARYANEMRREPQYENMLLREALPIIGERWRSLSAEEKRPYEDEARTELIKYWRELDEYRTRGK